LTKRFVFKNKVSADLTTFRNLTFSSGKKCKRYRLWWIYSKLNVEFKFYLKMSFMQDNPAIEIIRGNT